MEKNELDRSLAVFMAGVSHDLKTPLNAVIGFSSVLLADSGGMEAEKLRQLGLVSSSAHQLLRRLDAVVEFFRIRAGAIRQEDGWLHPEDLIRQAVDTLQEVAEQQGITLRVGSLQLPDRIYADPNRIQRILHELTTNAIRATKDGEVCLEATTDALARPETVRVTVTVSDTGSGIEAQHRDRLVRALGPVFLEKDGARKANFEGLGLGLALSREAANLLGGWIELDTEKDRGTRISLVLELAGQQVEGANPARQ